MTAAKRALLYLTRKKGRSILLILIIFIMSSFIMVGLALKMSAGKEIERIRRNLGSSFVIGIPVENELYYEPAPEPLPSSCKIYVGPKVTQNAIENILNIEGVTGYFSEYAGIPIYTNLDLRPGLYAEDGAFSEKELKILQHTTHIYRMTDGDLYPAFRTGALEMIDGRNIKLEDHHTIIISEYFAEKNHLSVGDTIELRISYTSTKLKFSLKGGPINLKVVGIFRTNIEQESSGFTLESQYMDNFMFSDFDTGKKVALLYFNKISADAVQLEYDYSARDAILLIITVCGISSGSVLAASRQIMKMEPQSLFQTL